MYNEIIDKRKDDLEKAIEHFKNETHIRTKSDANLGFNLGNTKKESKNDNLFFSIVRQ